MMRNGLVLRTRISPPRLQHQVTGRRRPQAPMRTTSPVGLTGVGRRTDVPPIRPVRGTVVPPKGELAFDAWREMYIRRLCQRVGVGDMG